MDNVAKEITRDTARVANYIARSKICNSGYLEAVNNMLKEDRTYKEVMDFLAAKDITVTPAQISKHKKFLPYLTEVEITDPMEAAMSEVREDKVYKRQELNNVELALETLQKTIQSSQVLAVNTLWGEVIPKMIENIQAQILEGNRISFKDTVDGLDKIVKIAQLLENKPTIIQAATVNGKAEVEHKHSIESIGDGSAESVSDFALDAIVQVNAVLQDYAKSRGEENGNTTLN